jgi:hypothetical protein
MIPRLNPLYGKAADNLVTPLLVKSGFVAFGSDTQSDQVLVFQRNQSHLLPILTACFALKGFPELQPDSFLTSMTTHAISSSKHKHLTSRDPAAEPSQDKAGGCGAGAIKS